MDGESLRPALGTVTDAIEGAAQQTIPRLRSFYGEPHPVIAWDHALGQAFAQYLVIEIGVHVGDDGTLRLEALDPGQCVVDTEMAGMRPIAQSVDDPEV